MDGTEFDDRFKSDNEGSFSVDGETLREFRYRYVKQINYVDPDDEDAKTIDDLRNGFTWIYETGGWVAIAARDLEFRDRIAACLQSATGATLTSLRFNKDVITRLESDDYRRRVALIDQQTHVTRRFTGRGLGRDQLALREIKKRLNRDDAPFSGYSVDVDPQAGISTFAIMRPVGL